MQNVRDILKHGTVIFTRDAISRVLDRLPPAARAKVAASRCCTCRTCT